MRQLLYLALAMLAPIQWANAAQDLPSLEIAGIKDPKKIINLQLKSLDRLRSMTKMTLEKINTLHAGIGNYQMIQDLYLQQPKDKEVLFKMTKMASNLLQEIKSAHLQHAIDPEFMKELKMFEKIYKKNELHIE
ncbi:MAG: hypothetical protein H0W50_04315 [Parachlamydiaceae bacterium]|nr:hypothetical protein [Parachlamydiaceae bacterium]